MHYKTWDRHDSINFTSNFNSREFVCQCGICKPQKISTELLDKLQQLREVMGVPLKITSAYRCVNRQAALVKNPNIQTVQNSQHTLGNAVDIACKDLDKLFEEAKKLFMAVGDGRSKGFIHVDIRKDKQRVWLY